MFCSNMFGLTFNAEIGTVDTTRGTCDTLTESKGVKCWPETIETN